MILGHQSRPGKDDFTDLSGHAERLGRHSWPKLACFVPDVCGEEAIDVVSAVCKMERFFCLDTMLECTMKKFSLKESSIGRSTTSSQIALSLAPELDAYVTDAFADQHTVIPPPLTGLSADDLPCELQGA